MPGGICRAVSGYRCRLHSRGVLCDRRDWSFYSGLWKTVMALGEQQSQQLFNLAVHESLLFFAIAVGVILVFGVAIKLMSRRYHG